MNCKITTTLLLSFVISLMNAQTMIPKNLVPNPSFEHQIDLPLRPNKKNFFEHEPFSGFIPFQRNIAFWKTGNLNTPDLRIMNSKNFSDCRGEFDYCVRPKTGQTMAGIITYMSNYTSKTYREYICSKLKSVVKPGIKTFVEIWVCKDRKAKLVSNNIGVYFSQKEVFEEIRENLSVEPHINWTEVVNKDGQRWEKVTGWFIPEKPYNHITIGNFYNNEHTTKDSSLFHSAHPMLEEYASYLIDDVRVWQENDTLEEMPIFEVVEKKPIRLENITFETNSAELKTSSIEELNKLLLFLQKSPKLKIAIHGHTDNVGNDDDNLALSKARAKAVVDFLVEKGIPEKRLTSEGFGEQQPIAPNQSADGRLMNRRVEFVVKNENLM